MNLLHDGETKCFDNPKRMIPATIGIIEFEYFTVMKDVSRFVLHVFLAVCQERPAISLRLTSIVVIVKITR
jgi:hypothetical protein